MSIIPDSGHVLEVWGDFACFSRPEAKVERYSYPCPTPSAARGVFEAIYFKPQFYWQVSKIELLSYPALVALRRNEVKEKLNPKTVQQWMTGKAPPEPLLADATGSDFSGRTQRQTMALRNPRFRLTAKIVPRPEHRGQQRAFDEQFIRRASQGKCFCQPCLGCREFVAFFRYIESLDNEPAPVAFNQKLGWMVYDVFDLRKANPGWRPTEEDRQITDRVIPPSISVFEAEITDGVLLVPEYEKDAVRKLPQERSAC